MKKCTMRRALGDPKLLGTILPGDSWLGWRALLIAAMGEELTDEERAAFARLTGRAHEPNERIEELWVISGRRGGKSRAAAVLGVYLATLCDFRAKLSTGEVPLVLFIAENSEQAAVCFNYCSGIIDSVPLLKRLVVNSTAYTLSLSSGIDLEVRAASFRGLRGVTCCAVIADEVCFWRTSEESVNADAEILNAIRPSLATTQGPLICVSSPYSRRGEAFNTWRAHYGPNGDARILVAQGASRDFNPSLPQSVVDRAVARDSARASAEFLGLFRTDLEAFIDLEVVQGLAIMSSERKGRTSIRRLLIRRAGQALIASRWRLPTERPTTGLLLTASGRQSRRFPRRR
jgi:hypothetical protein